MIDFSGSVLRRISKSELQAELTDLKQNYLEQMTAVKETHVKLMEERK